jgi:zinc/manganese transport system permease protein
MLTTVVLRAAIATPRPSWNLAHDVNQMLQYPFMRHAFVAGTVAAVVAGAFSYFVILRQSSFAAHALSEIGFAGAAGGVAYGFGAVPGLLIMALGGGALIGLLGKRLRGRDAAIGLVLAFSLGLGYYFVTKFKSSSASSPFGLLFGQILGVSVGDIWTITIVAASSLVVLAVIYRPLLFASLDEDVAEARGVPVRALSVGFFMLLAAAVTAAVQVVGVLLIFALLVAPGAIADRMCRTTRAAIGLCVVLALAFVWIPLTVAYYTSFPTGFLVSTMAFVVYLLARVATAVPWDRVGSRGRAGSAVSALPDRDPPVARGPRPGMEVSAGAPITGIDPRQ